MKGFGDTLALMERRCCEIKAPKEFMTRMVRRLAEGQETEADKPFAELLGQALNGMMDAFAYLTWAYEKLPPEVGKPPVDWAKGATMKTWVLLNAMKRDMLKKYLSQKVTASMASVPHRAGNLPEIVASILPQVDHLNVYLNGYDAVPECLRSPKISIARSQNHGDLGAAGKFWWCEQIDGYHFTIDDDIKYPSDYVKRMVFALEEYDNEAVFCVHGTYFQNGKCLSWSRDRGGYHFITALDRHRRVNVPGTGTVAYHAQRVDVKFSDFKNPNMIDLWFSINAKERGYKCYAISRNDGWLGRFDEPRGTAIYDRDLKDDSFQTEEANKHWPWFDCDPKRKCAVTFPAKPPAKRIGMVLRDDTGGLGNISRDFYRRFRPDKYVVIKYGQGVLNCNAYDETKASCVLNGDLGNLRNIFDDAKARDFLTGLDAVICFETPYNWRLFDIAREMGVKSYLMIMWEWTPDPMPLKPDHILVPQDWYRDQIKALGCETSFIHLPVDRRKFKFQKKTKATTFLVNAGRSGKSPGMGPIRDGTDLFFKALPLVKAQNVKFVVRSSYKLDQINDPRVTLDCTTKKESADNYAVGDMLVLPRRFQAMSMPCHEALSVGMPILTTKLLPHAQGFPEGWIIRHRASMPLMLNRGIMQVVIDPADVAAKIDEWAGKDISAESEAAGNLAESFSWQKLEPAYRKVLGHPWRIRKVGIPVKTGKNSSWATETHYAKSFEELGYDVVRIDPKNGNPQEVLKVLAGCDIFFSPPIGFMDFIGTPGLKFLELLKDVGIVSVGHHYDLFWGIGVREAVVSREQPFFAADYCFTSDAGNQARFAKLGINHIGIAPGVYQGEAVMGTPRNEWKCDILFCGSCFYPHAEWQFRSRLLTWLRQTYGRRFSAWGPGTANGMIRDLALNDLYASAKIVIGDAMWSPEYTSDRLFEVPGRGGFLVFPKFPGAERYFTDGKDLVFYDNEKGKLDDFRRLKEILDYWINHDVERIALQKASHEHVKKNHTHAHRIREIVDIVERGENERRSV